MSNPQLSKILQFPARVSDRHFADLGLNRIFMTCTPENLQSQRTPLKLGFKMEGVLRQDHFQDGRFQDTIMYELLREEWKARGGK